MFRDDLIILFELIGWLEDGLWYLFQNFLEEEVGVFLTEVTLNKLLRVEDVCDFWNLFVCILLVDVRYEAVTHPFNVVHRHIEIHLLLYILDEVILWESIVNYLLVHFWLFELILLLNHWGTKDVMLLHGSGRSVILVFF